MRVNHQWISTLEGDDRHSFKPMPQASLRAVRDVAARTSMSLLARDACNCTLNPRRSHLKRRPQFLENHYNIFIYIPVMMIGEE